VLDWAAPRRLGFSHVISLGDMADVDFGDMLDYLAADRATSAILLYVEGLKEARKFMSAARAAARAKPVLVVKVGRFAEAARAATSHTGALAGSDAVYEAAFRRAGMLRVSDMIELFDAVETLALTERQRGERLAIVANGGGPGVLATDELIGLGGKLAKLTPATLARLDSVLPRTWSRSNPIDIIGDADGRRYSDALSVLFDDEGIDAILMLNCPTALAEPAEVAKSVTAVVAEAKRNKRLIGRNVLTAWLGEHSAAPARRCFDEARIAAYDTPNNALRGFMHRVNYRRHQELLMETPAARPDNSEPDPPTVRPIIAHALDTGRTWLEADEVGKVLVAYGIPFATPRVAANPDTAASAAAALGFPVALKICSPELTHKSDVGGVRLDLKSAEEVRAEAAAMHRRLLVRQPAARLNGFLVQPMVRRPRALELIVGLLDDPVFGPVVMFGHGGTAVEVRPVRPEDEPLLLGLTQHMSADDMRLRFFAPMKGISHSLAARLSQIDYDREMALIAEPEYGSAVLGEARFAADPDNRRAEFAVAVCSEMKRRGLGRMLMMQLIEVARQRGIAVLFGDVLRGNEAMLGLARTLGFTTDSHGDDVGTLRIALTLSRP
jgi:acetyltransferase